jgi:hypothetical protein
MNRLVEIGFMKAGRWHLADGVLAFELDQHLRKRRNILYAFVCDSQVKYVGKTVQALGTRLTGYRTPGKDQSTNIRNHHSIKGLLRAGKEVEIFAFPDSGMLKYGQFHLNIAAGLEDSLIATIDPDWNGGKRSEVTEEVPESPEVTEAPSATFPLVIEQTYYEHGFFNVRIQYGELFGTHGQTIEIFLGDSGEPIYGTINRTAASNGAPRIMGGRRVRDWLQQHCKVQETIEVEVTSPTSIRLRKPPAR